MGVWGMGLAQSDEYCEIYACFMEKYDEGKPVADISKEILEKYLDEFDSDDGVLHDVYFALAKAEWMAGEQSQQILKRVEDIIASEINLEFYRELGANEDDLRIRKKNLDKFLRDLHIPRAVPRKRKHANKPLPALLQKGEVFWYRSRGEVYGALVLENIRNEAWFVVLTNELDGEPKTLEHVLQADVFVATWFLELLPKKRIHSIGKIEVEGNYNGRGGMYYSEKVKLCENLGGDETWKKSIIVRINPDMNMDGLKVRDLLDVEQITNDFVIVEKLQRRIDEARTLYGDASVKLI